MGLEAEKASTIRHGASAIASLYMASIPWYLSFFSLLMNRFSVMIRRCFGVAGAGKNLSWKEINFYSAFVDRGDPDLRVCWPSGDWGSLPFEGGIEAAFKRKLSHSQDSEKVMNEVFSQKIFGLIL